ncbi:MAG TPA: phosphoglucosamine mutase [Candidatus Kapabacteria bacterium]|nr:phosphoglucosamine mutase [Candidatus Kapabacteria bacterium]
MPIIRSISGLRATISDYSLIPDLIEDYIYALTNRLSKGPVVVGWDGRGSGDWIEDLIRGILTYSGFDVIALGIVPTPTVQLITESMKAEAGIVVTASHNSEDWNGLKFINSSGTFFDTLQNKLLWYYADNGYDPKTGLHRTNYISNKKGTVIIKNDAIQFHIDKIMELPFWKSIKQHPLRATVDAVNASGSVAIPLLLERLGCSVDKLYCDINGHFPHTPEPLPANLLDLCNAVHRSNSQIGIAVDPDADRLVLIDENGMPIGEENTIVLAVWSVLELSEDPSKVSIVVNHSTTQAVEDIAAKYGAIVYRCPVGEYNVVNKMQETGAIIGGEGSGGVIYAPLHYGRDSLIGTSLVLALMWKLNKKLSELKAMLPYYTMAKAKIPFQGNYTQIMQKIRLNYRNYKINDEDGLKIYLDNSWVQVRKSNTEPIIRIIAEAKNKTSANDLINEIKNILKKI